MDEELTEEVVEGIYTEHLRKLKEIPGYAVAFQAVYDQLHNVIDDKSVDKQAFDEAMFRLFMTEITG